MLRLQLLCHAILAVLTAGQGFAATNIVLQGDNLQAKIDAAAPGDIMVVQSGGYAGNTTVTKPLSFVRSGTDPIQIMNPFTIQTTGTVSISQFQFLMDVSGTSPDARFYDCQLNSSLGMSDGKLTLKRVSIANALNVTRMDLDALRLTNYGLVTISGASSDQTKVMIVQSQLRSRIDCGHSKLWMGYSFAQGFNCGYVDAVVVGCDFFSATAHFGTYGWVTGCQFDHSSFRVYNSRIYYVDDWAYHRESQAVVVVAEGCAGEFQNCDIMIRGGGWPGAFAGNGHGIAQWGSRTTIKNCLFDLASHGGDRLLMVDYHATMDVADCIVYGHFWMPFGFGLDDVHAGIQGGEARNIPVRTRVVTDPCVLLNFSDQWSFTSTITTNSPILNAGSEEPIYRNVDGTRNTVGSTGGPFYHPENATTDRPIAFWLMTSPRKVLKGVDNTLKMDAAAAAGH